MNGYPVEVKQATQDDGEQSPPNGKNDAAQE
jgi:hypothetical protein